MVGMSLVRVVKDFIDYYNSVEEIKLDFVNSQKEHD